MMHGKTPMPGSIACVHGFCAAYFKFMFFYIAIKRSFRLVRYLKIEYGAFFVLAGRKGKHAHIHININKRHPHGYGIVGIDRPIVLVLVPGGWAAAGLLK